MIRTATIKDYESVVKLALDFARASEKVHKCSVSEIKVRATIRTAIAGDDWLLLVSELEGTVDGFLLAIRLQPCFSNDWVLQELGLYAKKATSVLHLLDDFEIEAMRLGVHKLIVGCKPAFCNLGNIYEHRKYVMLEEQYLKGV